MSELLCYGNVLTGLPSHACLQSIDLRQDGRHVEAHHELSQVSRNEGIDRLLTGVRHSRQASVMSFNHFLLAQLTVVLLDVLFLGEIAHRSSLAPKLD